MSILCSLGLHHWQSHPTLRPGTTVHRCAWCGTRALTHGGRQRRRKRIFFGAALLVSAGMWFVGYNLLVHGRTRVLHTASTSARKVATAASHGRNAVHRIEGDRGSYVEGKD